MVMTTSTTSARKEGYWTRMVRKNRKKNKVVQDNAPPQKAERKPVVPSAIKPPKKKQSTEKWNREGKQNFSHEWLLTSLKGHSGAIMDMDFSANGKFLATCADDDPGGTSGSSSGSEANKENNSPGRNHKQLSRRQKKNRVRKEDSSPPLKKKPKKQRHTVLRQYAKLNLNDADLFKCIKDYALHPEDLFLLGYPVESKLYPGRAMIFKSASKPFDVNAKEFVPRNESVYASLIVQNGSEQFEKYTESPIKRIEKETSEEKKCGRCSKSFFISTDGEYLTQEHCMYHWGKLLRPQSGGTESYYSCCKGKKNTKGCTTAKLHVWSGIDPGRNGPYDGYVRTRPKKIPPSDGNFGIYALDCEMCFTTTGLELTKISVVAHDGRLVYDTYVRPENFIIDYNTRFSGITAKDLSRKTGTKLLKDVQNDLMGFITADTVLVGHGLENDLRALRMIHTTVVDTAIVFPHAYGLPFRRSLKSLVNTILKRDIQSDVSGHDSCEDARSCLELILWKIRKDRIRDDIDNNK
ncbi:RNA exonuclease 1 homolog isoform X2 [Rhodnius prolixus]|uniref:RNA exonuclease 1 homolog isoform X2 n=1 Tax=Rhodnius prolixus TaxID=13249 RepID=UPI003D18E23D